MATAQGRRGPVEIGTNGKAKTKRAGPRGSSGGQSPAGGRGETAPLDEERVRERAYGIWIAEGQPEGREVDHWLRARGELERKAA